MASLAADSEQYGLAVTDFITLLLTHSFKYNDEKNEDCLKIKGDFQKNALE